MTLTNGTNLINMTYDTLLHAESTPKPQINPAFHLYAIVYYMSIIIVNCALLAFFYKHKHKVWTTYFFLSNLTVTDILIGSSLLLTIVSRHYVPWDVEWVICHLPISFPAGIMGAYCLLILSIQVQYLNHHFIN